MAPIIALKKLDQKKVVKKSKRITKQVQTGKIQIREKRKQQRQKLEEKRGLIYIGHLPHGFFEEEMRNYFKQFGRVTNLKVCRSSRTGNSKGYGYVEFQYAEVAQIAAETMHNYVMFKKRLVSQFIPYEKRPPHIFHGKQSMPEKFSKLRRREQTNETKNREISSEKHVEQSKMRLTRLQKKIARINEFGVEYALAPVNVPENLAVV